MPPRVRPEIIELEELGPVADADHAPLAWWRRHLLVVSGALVGTIIGASVIAFVASRHDDKAVTLSTGGPVAQLEVVGRGLQQIAADAGGTNSAVWVVVLRNPSSDLAAVDARLTVRLYDDTGRAVAIVDDAISVILPGQRAASIGVIPAPSATHVDVDVRTVGSRVVPRGRSITIDHIKVDSQGRATSVAATITSGYNRTLTNPFVVAVIRDATGAIVGGGSKQLGILDPGRPVEVDIDARAVPKRAAGADVYVIVSDINEITR